MPDAKHSPVPWSAERVGHSALRIVDAAGDDVLVERVGTAGESASLEVTTKRLCDFVRAALESARGES